MWRHTGLHRGCLAAAVCVVLQVAGAAQAQERFGLEARAAAAQQMIILGVQQGITSLPPTSGQAFAYEYDAKTDLFVRSERLGPTAFRAPQTIGAGNFSVRVAASYFELDHHFGPITYDVTFDTDPAPGTGVPRNLVTKFSVNASAQVALINVGANYGLGNRAELLLNVPLVVTDVSAAQGFPVRVGGNQAPDQVNVAGARSRQELEDLLAGRGCAPQNCAEFRGYEFDDLGVRFEDGTNVGVGRISAGGKALLVSGPAGQLAFATELFFPSPHEDEFAGSESFAVLPRFIGALKFSDVWRFHLDAGYDYDFDHDELRRFVWNSGLSAALERVTFDFGVGGSLFNSGIEWTPSVARFEGATVQLENGSTVRLPDGTITVIPGAGNELGSNFVDFLGGVKVRLTERTVLSGAVNVPINDQGFRADAVGTLALEVYL